ncbi:MAG: hypothetical protein AABY52_01960 [Deltaproteobacteria bacterium]
MQRKVNIIFLVFLWAVAMAATAHSAEWRWNGYFGANYEDSTKANANGSFDTFVLSVITNVKIDENLRLLAQVDWEHAPYFEVASDKTLVKRSSGELTLSNAYGEYTVADYLKIKAGKFFTPVGLQNLIFYALPTYPYLKIPRESVYRKGSTAQTDATFFQRYAQGVWLAGDIPVALLSYDVYVSNGKSDTDHADDNTTKGVGGRLQVNLTLGEVMVKPTASYYNDKYIETSRIKEQGTIIPGIDVTAGDMVVRGEYANSAIKNDSAAGTKKFSAYYAEAYYTIAEKYTPYLRYEWWEPNKDVVDDEETETTVGVSYHIIPWVAQVKAQVRFHDYEKETTTNQAYNIYGIGLALGF